jgi:hypothetical protein
MAVELVRVNAIAAKSELSGDYCIGLLEKALNASKSPNEIIDLSFREPEYSQLRLFAALEVVQNGVVWSMNDTERDWKMLRIKIPLFKGLLGKRVFLIRKDQKSRFDSVSDLQDLRKLVAGQGSQWPDTRILQSNGLPTVTAAATMSLTKMLKAKRFDYFPRAAVEAWYELDHLNDESLMVEENIVLSYPTDLYFYVSLQNTVLAERIEKGLNILIKSGEFDRYFYSHPRMSKALKLLEGHRKVFELSVYRM